MKFQWLNESEIKLTDDRIEIMAPGQTDFFCGSIDECEEGILPESLCNAPYYYTEVEGDFVLQVKVSHDFKDTYDSASVMVMKDETCWAKCCYELTDFGTHAAVSVVTKGDSDGCKDQTKTEQSEGEIFFHFTISRRCEMVSCQPVSSSAPTISVPTRSPLLSTKSVVGTYWKFAIPIMTRLSLSTRQEKRLTIS